MNPILTLIQKEWADVFRHRYVLFIVLLMPVLLVVIPILVMGLGADPNLIAGMGDEVPPAVLAQPAFAALEPEEAMQAFVGQQFNLFFLIVPLAIPMTIATYSIVGEKRERSLEPLLATPISTAQLLAAKSIAAAGPGVLGLWLAALLYTIALQIVVPSAAVRGILLSPPFYVSVLVVGPLLTVLATTVGLSISSRVNDPRVAEQLGMVVIVPVLGFIFAQIAGLITYDVMMALGFAVALAVVDLILLLVAVRLFRRETILTRWR